MLSYFILFLASIPATMFLINVEVFRTLPPARRRGQVSVLIPARNEEHAIGEALESVLANTGVDLEVVVLDDGSTDGTAEIVKAMAASDPRVRLATGIGLPAGWCGKQHACWLLAQQARYDLLCFLDADVRLSPDALGRMVDGIAPGTALLSGFPRQITVTFLERLLIPMIHFVLLGFLPVPGMKRSNDPAFAAGCGQLMLARRDEYFRAGGHSAIRATLHDGLNLPRIFREAGFHTDIFDATSTASVRMYHNASEVWWGLMKNAVEGLAAPSRLPVFTILLAGGQVAPFVLLALAGPSPVAVAAVVLAWLPRLLMALRFRQPLDSAVLHPIGITVLLVLQWTALVRHWRRVPSSWKGRSYTQS